MQWFNIHTLSWKHWRTHGARVKQRLWDVTCFWSESQTEGTQEGLTKSLKHQDYRRTPCVWLWLCMCMCRSSVCILTVVLTDWQEALKPQQNRKWWRKHLFLLWWRKWFVSVFLNLTSALKCLDYTIYGLKRIMVPSYFANVPIDDRWKGSWSAGTFKTSKSLKVPGPSSPDAAFELLKFYSWKVPAPLLHMSLACFRTWEGHRTHLVPGTSG